MVTLGEAIAHARPLAAAGQTEAAEDIYRQMLAAVPQAAELWHELGLIQLQAGRPQMACDSLAKAVSLEPDQAAFHANLGLSFRVMKRTAEAIASFERSVQLSPAAEVYSNLALAHKDAGDTQAALQAFDAALALRGDYANGHFNRANLLLEIGRLDEAVEGYRRAIELQPLDAGAYCKLAIAYYDLGRLDEALECCDRALQIQPDYPEARRNCGIIWLAQGDYARGWAAFEWRYECEGFANRSLTQPRWDGTPLAGRRLFVYAEQGLGDTLQFIRYIPEIERLGGQVNVEVQKPLIPLLECSGFGRWLVQPSSAPPQFDVHCPLLSLPYLLRERGGLPFWPGAYLHADPSRLEPWKMWLQSTPRFKVGIAWAGNPDHPHDRFRSVSLAQFAPLAAVEGVQLISLQKGRTAVADAANVNLLDLGDAFDATGGAFMDSAAVMQHLDLVIAVDTSIVHLAGGLGVAVWVPLQRSPDWRWGTSGPETPWYPTMRLFRQQECDAWGPVFQQMAAALRPLAKPAG